VGLFWLNAGKDRFGEIGGFHCRKQIRPPTSEESSKETFVSPSSFKLQGNEKKKKKKKKKS